MSKDWKLQIVCAACKYGDVLICGARHYDMVMHSQLMAFDEASEVRSMNRGEVVQGFIDNQGKFYNRKDAMKLVIKSGQPFNAERNSGSGEDLYSEGLY